MSSGAVVRLQNLPWSASAPDVRNFFRGLDIPNGGVRIIGGDDGDCFVLFTSESDSQHAIRKDGSYLNDQRVKLNPSSEEEMRYVIAIAKGENPPKPASMYVSRESSYTGGYNNRKRPSSPQMREQPPSKYGERSVSNRSEQYQRTLPMRDRPVDHHDNSTHSTGQNASRYDAASAESRRSMGNQWNSGDDDNRIGGDEKSKNDDQHHSIKAYSTATNQQSMSDMGNSSLSTQQGPTYYNKYDNKFSDNPFGRTEPDVNMPASQDKYSIPTGPKDTRQTNLQTQSSNFNKDNDFRSAINSYRGQWDDHSTDQKANSNCGYPQDNRYQHSTAYEYNENIGPSPHTFQHRRLDLPSGLNSENAHILPTNQYGDRKSLDGNRIMGNKAIREYPPGNQIHPPPSMGFISNQPQANSLNMSKLEFETAGNQGNDYTQRPGKLDYSEPPPLLHNKGIFPDEGADFQRPIQPKQHQYDDNFPNYQEQVPREYGNRQLLPQKFGGNDRSFENQTRQHNDTRNLSPLKLQPGNLQSGQFHSMENPRQFMGLPMGRPQHTFEGQRRLPPVDLDHRRPLFNTNNNDDIRLPPPARGDFVTHKDDMRVKSNLLMDSDLRNPSASLTKLNKELPVVRASQSAGLLPTPDAKPNIPPLLGPKIGTSHTDNINFKSNIQPRLPFPQKPIGPAMPVLPAMHESASRFNGPRPRMPPQSPMSLMSMPSNFRENDSSMLAPVNNDRGRLPPNLLNQPPPLWNNNIKNSLTPRDNTFSQRPPAATPPTSPDPLPSSDAPTKPQPVVPVADPCASITNLPGDVNYKQLRGLFATHNIIARDIVINWPVRRSSDPASAIIFFEDINNTVIALNELRGMKISGHFIVIEPCSKSKFENSHKAQDRKSITSLTQAPGDNSQPPVAGHVPTPIPLTRRHEPPSASPQSDRNTSSDRPNRGGRREDRDRRSSERSRDRRRSNSPPRNFSSRNRSPRRTRSPPRRRSPPPHRELPYSRDSRGDNRRARSSDRSNSQDDRNNSYQSTSKSTSKNLDSQRLAEDRNSPASYWCAVLTGLPPKATKADVEKLLSGVNYETKTLYLEFNVHKECTGTAYVELASENDQRLLTNSPKEVLKQTVHISSVTKDQMRDHVNEHRKNLAADKTKPGDFVIQLIGLPFDATPKTVSEFLHPTSIKENEVTLVKSPDGSGRCSGNGFAKVHSIDERDEALKHDRGYIGKRYVTVRVVSEMAMKDFISKYDAKLAAEVSLMNRQSDPDVDRTIKMVNLRYEIKGEEVETFFRGFNPEPGSATFNMMNGMPTGKGSIKMKTSADALKAVDHLNKCELSGRPLLLSVYSSI